MTTTQAPLALQAIRPTGTPAEAGVTAVLAAAFLGLCLTVYAMAGAAYSSKYLTDVEAMKDTSQWVVWVLVLAIQTATWFALLVPIIRVTAASKAQTSKSLLAHIAVVSGLLILPFMAMLMFERTHSVQGAFTSRLVVLSFVGSIVGLVAAIGVLRTGVQIEETQVSESPSEVDVANYREVRRRLTFLGAVLALIVGLALLATGGQRNTIVAMETARASEEKAASEITAGAAKNEHLRAAAEATRRASRFGVDLVWGYGLYYSYVLILVYLPAYLSLLSLGRRLRDALAPEVLPTNSTFENSKKVRDALDDVLQLRLGAAESLKVATLILVPVATSLASTLLGGVKVGGG